MGQVAVAAVVGGAHLQKRLLLLPQTLISHGNETSVTQAYTHFQEQSSLGTQLEQQREPKYPRSSILSLVTFFVRFEETAIGAAATNAVVAGAGTGVGAGSAAAAAAAAAATAIDLLLLLDAAAEFTLTALGVGTLGLSVPSSSSSAWIKQKREQIQKQKTKNTASTSFVQTTSTHVPDTMRFRRAED